MYPLNQNLPQYSHWRVQRWMNTDCARRLLRVTLKQKEMACTLSQFWDKTFFLWKTLNTCQFLHTLWFCVLNAGLFSFCLNVFFVYFFHLEAKSTESRTCCSNSDSVWTNQRHGEIFIINKVNIPSGKKSSLYAQSTVVLCQKLRPAWNVFFFFAQNSDILIYCQHLHCTLRAQNLRSQMRNLRLVRGHSLLKKIT